MYLPTCVAFDGPASASGLGSLARARLAAAGCSPACEGECDRSRRAGEPAREPGRLPGGGGEKERGGEGLGVSLSRLSIGQSLMYTVASSDPPVGKSHVAGSSAMPSDPCSHAPASTPTTSPATHARVHAALPCPVLPCPALPMPCHAIPAVGLPPSLPRPASTASSDWLTGCCTEEETMLHPHCSSKV